MKIAFFIYSLSSGGAERVTATLANHWAAKGWSVTVVTVTSRRGDFYSLHPGVERVALELDRPSRGYASAIVNNVARFRALRSVLRALRPDVAVAMMVNANCLLAWASRGMKLCVVGSERVHPPTLELGWLWNAIRYFSYRYLDGVVAQSQTSAEWLERNIRGVRVTVIPNPIDPPSDFEVECIEAHDPLPAIGQRRVLLAVGRLEVQKGFDRLLRAFATVSSKHPDWRLVILGEGSERAALEEQVCALGLDGRVLLPGVTEHVDAWYRRADLFVLSSRFEGFPNALLEALACGVPAVAVNCETGPSEILRHEVDGLLVPQGDPEPLIMALDRLMSGDDERAGYATRAIEVRERFATPRIAARWEECFTRV